MTRALWLRFFALSCALALLLSGLYLAMMREVAGAQTGEVQRSLYLFLARMVESQPYAEAIRHIEDFRVESPAMPLDLWVVSGDGRVLAGSKAGLPPERLMQMPRPRQIHEATVRGRFFSGGVAGAVVRLDAPEPTYLLVGNPGTPARGTFLILAGLFVATLVGAIFMGLLLVALYLRGRSREAKRVIARIESGDLGARFDNDRLDAIGGLMLDFNRMADEIQRLVARLQNTERARRELLQEIGHDLRTPLTGLRTAIETLAAHGRRMQEGEREEFLRVAAGELAYFGKLIDDLFFIAGIDEPRYRKKTERIDLDALLASEVHAAQSGGRLAADSDVSEIQFELRHDQARQPCTTVGDAYLISRLLRNALDNAARHARSRVRATVASNGDFIDVAIEDDGPGMSAEAIAEFGTRRSRRVSGGSAGAHVSLGLGSVIIRTVVELHGGRLSLSSRALDPEIAGTRIMVSFPVDRSETAMEE